MAHVSPSRPDRAHEDLTRRAERSRRSYARRAAQIKTLTRPGGVTRALKQLRHCPPRFWLHLMIGLLVPLTIILNQRMPVTQLQQPVDGEPSAAMDVSSAEIVLSLGPIEINRDATVPLEDQPAPDSAFAEIMALPDMGGVRSRQEMLAPVTVSTTVLGDRVNLWSGPGQVYDSVDILAAGTALTLERIADDWFVARTSDGRQGWVAAEVVADAEPARNLLLPATDIPPPPPPKVALVTQNDLTMRDGPGTGYVKLHAVDSGITIDLLSRFEQWFEVRLPTGQIGWVTGDYLQIADGVIARLEVLPTPPDPTPQLVAQTDGTINVRGGPGTAYPKIGVTGAGTQLDVIGRYKEWLQVRTPAGKIARVAGEVLPVRSYVARRIPVTSAIPAVPKPAQNTAAQAVQAARPVRSVPSLSPAQAGSVASFALQFRGAPYVWGGSRPGAFDCSGFTKYVYAQHGLRLPHSAAGQYSQSYGTFIDRSSLQPGDLVFFANTYKRGISHVGVYVGGGMVAQALAPGTPLSAVSMQSDYWNAKYYGALRPRL